MDESKPCILIAEDDIDQRIILRDTFMYGGYSVLVSADGEEALRLAQTHPVDVALLDVRMPGLSGLELVERLNQINPDILIIMLSAYVSAQDAVEAARRGAIYYLPKPCPPSCVQTLVEDIWATHLSSCREQIGEIWVDWKKQTILVGGRVHSLRALSQREQAVLDELVQGKADAQIAETLGISLPTVRTHLQNIMRKLGLNREHLLMVWDRYQKRVKDV